MPLQLRYTDCMTELSTGRCEMSEAIHCSKRKEPTASGPPLAPVEAARQRRIAALKMAEGLWKDRTDTPKDGIQAQEQLRDEWR